MRDFTQACLRQIQKSILANEGTDDHSINAEAPMTAADAASGRGMSHDIKNPRCPY
jgi:hypothetical protein